MPRHIPVALWNSWPKRRPRQHTRASSQYASVLVSQMQIAASVATAGPAVRPGPGRCPRKGTTQARTQICLAGQWGSCAAHPATEPAHRYPLYSNSLPLPKRFFARSVQKKPPFLGGYAGVQLLTQLFPGRVICPPDPEWSRQVDATRWTIAAPPQQHRPCPQRDWPGNQRLAQTGLLHRLSDR